MKFCDDIKLMYMYYIMDVNDVLIFIERWNFGNYFIISMIEFFGYYCRLLLDIE